MQKRPKYPEFIRRKRVICPECKGKKEGRYYNEKEDYQYLDTCVTCEGEGIVMMEMRIVYKKLKDAK